jgi:integrase
MRGDGRIFQRAEFYWVAYYLRGKEYREAAKTKDGKNTTDPKVAEKFLRARLKDVHADEVGGRAFTTPKACRLTVHDLVESLKADYELRGKLSAQNASYLKRVQSDFGEYRAVDLTAEHVDRYIEQRRDENAAKASINRVTQMLGQAYTLAIRRGYLARKPHIRQLDESGNVRQGFFNETEFVAVLAKLPNDLQDFASWCFATGMRRGEAASLTWGMLQSAELRIPGDICKNRKPRVLPLGSELARIIERRRLARRAVIKGVICMDGCEFIFHRGGKPVGEFRKSWHSACVAAGLGKIACTGLRE